MNANPKDSLQHVVGMPAEPPQRSGAEPRSHEPPAALHGRLLQVSRMATIGEMAAGVAHELNQPLTAIANYAQACSRLLSRPGTDPSEVQQALSERPAHAMRDTDKIRRLRGLARGRQSGRASANVNTLVREIMD